LADLLACVSRQDPQTQLGRRPTHRQILPHQATQFYGHDAEGIIDAAPAKYRLRRHLKQMDGNVRSQVSRNPSIRLPCGSRSRRVRDREHVRHVAQQTCLVCGRRPLCRGYHRELYRHGDEAAWRRKVAIDPLATARTLWLESRPIAKVPGALMGVTRSG
jgi:hypothetical protein